MFYYYGRKKQIARYYPAPQCDTIVEPFAGAASYAMFGSNWQKQVILVEKDQRVGAIWQWLIEEATAESIRQLPDVKQGQKSSDFLHILHAATKMAFRYKTIKVTAVLERNWEFSKRNMAENVHKVKHWQLIVGDYTQAPELVATWFIDPPYRREPGEGYRHSSRQLDYERLAEWTSQRRGQLICCEGPNGDYLPFTNLLQLTGVAGKQSREQMYHRPLEALGQNDCPK